MPSEPVWMPLESCLEALIDYRGKTPEKTQRGVPLITAKVVKNGVIETPNEFVAEEAYSAWMRRGMPKAGDVLLTTEAPLGEVAQLESAHVALAQRIILLRGKEGVLDNGFLKYFFMTEEGRGRLQARATGTTVIGIKQSELRKVEVPVPPIGAQKAIAETLGALDNKIALLRETNATREAIAHALFKSWFVDFDPVRAKAEGREPDGVPPEVADLFPSEFEGSELGPIPKGWAVGSIGQIAQVIDCLHAKKPELLPVGLPFLQLNNIRDDGLLDLTDVAQISDPDYKKWTSRIEVSEGDCVITNVGRVGAVAQIPSGFSGAMGRNMTAIRLKTDWPYPTFLIELLQSQLMRAEIERLTDVGTILNALNVKSIPLLRCTLAGPSIMGAFEDISRPLRAAMESNLKQQKTLSTLRDTLLPRLMSGKLRIPEITESIEEVTA